MAGYQVLVGDCRQTMKTLADRSVQCVVTSPPYYQLRDYNMPGQLGLESTPESFIAALVEVFNEVHRVLADDGLVWLNLGDSYVTRPNGNIGKNSQINGKQTHEQYRLANGRRAGNIPDGLKHKDMVGIPWRMAFALQGFAVVPAAHLSQWADWLAQARAVGDWQMVQMVETRMRASLWLDALAHHGWYLRQDIIWSKPNPMPESVRDRCTKSHEYIFLLSKSEQYFFDNEAIKEPVTGGAKSRGDGKNPKSKANAFGSRQNERFSAAVAGMVESRNRRSVWSVSTKPYKGAHFATFPPDLIEACILAGTSDYGHCPDCSARWVRIINKKTGFAGGSGRAGRTAEEMNGRGKWRNGGKAGNKNLKLGPTTTTTTTGWMPSCACYDARYQQDFSAPRSERKRNQRSKYGDRARRVRARPGISSWPVVTDVVLDPFGGTGTTAGVAVLHGREAIICELNPEYVEFIPLRVEQINRNYSYRKQGVLNLAPSK